MKCSSPCYTCTLPESLMMISSPYVETLCTSSSGFENQYEEVSGCICIYLEREREKKKMRMYTYIYIHIRGYIAYIYIYTCKMNTCRARDRQELLSWPRPGSPYWVL